MKAAIILMIVVLVLGYSGAQMGGIYKTKSELAARVEYQLDFVDEGSMGSVKQDLVRDADRLGIKLSLGDINIVYADTEKVSLPQKLVGPKVAQFTNKQVAITVRYAAHLLGFPLRQEITRSKIKQIQVRRIQPAMPQDPMEPGE